MYACYLTAAGPCRRSVAPTQLGRLGCLEQQRSGTATLGVWHPCEFSWVVLPTWLWEGWLVW